MILLDGAGRANVAATHDAWTRFVRTGELAEGLVRPHVARAWKRSREAGCKASPTQADTLSNNETAKLLAAHRTLIETARPFLSALSRAAGSAHHAAMLGDRHARVLDVVGDPQSIEGPHAVPGPGSRLDEATAGANGLGSPIAERGYVELIGPEHFSEGFHVYTCQGIPLLDADRGVIGVLGISVRRLDVADRIRDILFCAASGVECELISRRLSMIVGTASGPTDPDLAERLRQDIVQQLAAARLHFEFAADRIARGLSVSELMSRGAVLVAQFRREADAWRSLADDAPHARTPVALSELLADMLTLLRTEARIAGIELRPEEHHPMIVMGDHAALSRTMLGLLLGAIQAAGRGGRIHVELDEASNGHAVMRARSEDLHGDHVPAPQRVDLGAILPW